VARRSGLHRKKHDPQLVVSATSLQGPDFLLGVEKLHGQKHEQKHIKDANEYFLTFIE